MKQIDITQQEQNQRLDKFLLKYLNKAPKGFIYKMLRKKRIKYNGKKGEGNEILQKGDCLQLYLSEQTIESFMEQKVVYTARRDFSTIYEDSDLLVVNKPAGLIVHPQKSDDKNTLIDQILYYLYEKGEYTPAKDSTFTPAICNRLDRNTSGIIIAGKNLKAVQAVNTAIAQRKVNKYYVTLVKGNITQAEKVVHYLEKESEKNQVILYDNQKEKTRQIITEYKPIAYAENMTLLEISLITGRSHQIRAQMQKIGHCIAGDRKYGEQQWNVQFRKFGLTNQFLHAYRVVWQQKEGALAHLVGKEWIAPLPETLQEICNFYFKK